MYMLPFNGPQRQQTNLIVWFSKGNVIFYTSEDNKNEDKSFHLGREGQKLEPD